MTHDLLASVVVRPMIGVDSEIVDRLEMESFFEKQSPWNGQPIGWSGVSELISSRDGFGIVAELPPKEGDLRNVLGFAVYSVVDDAMIIQRVCAYPQRQGIGTLMVLSMQMRMISKKRSSLITAVRADDVNSRAFFLRSGFECAGRYLSHDGTEFFDYALTSV